MTKKRIEEDGYFWDSDNDQWYPIGSEEPMEQVLGTPGFVSLTGNVINKTSGDCKDLMKNIKKGSGRSNTIKT